MTEQDNELVDIQLADQPISVEKVKIKVTPETITQSDAFAPRAPMVGPRGVVANLLAARENRLEKGMSVLKMSGSNDQTPNLSFEGPCYFLDVAFENFSTAISIDSK